MSHSILHLAKDIQEPNIGKDDHFYKSLKQNKLALPKFPLLEFFCIPHIGVYGDDYFPTTPISLIELDYTDKLALPTNLKAMLADLKCSSVEIYAIIHSSPRYGECQKFTCCNHDEFNVMYHAWAFPTYEIGEESIASEKMNVGIYDAIGVQQVHINLSDAGLVFDASKEYSVVIHGMAFSPENMMMQVSHEFGLASFFALGVIPSSQRVVISLHLLPVTSTMEQAIRSAVEKSMTIQSLLDNIKQVDDSPNQASSSKLESLLLSA